MHAFKFSCTDPKVIHNFIAAVKIIIFMYWAWLVLPIIAIKLFNPILGKLVSKQQPATVGRSYYMTCCVYSTVWIQLHSQKFGTVPDLIMIALALGHTISILIFKVMN